MSDMSAVWSRKRCSSPGEPLLLGVLELAPGLGLGMGVPELGLALVAFLPAFLLPGRPISDDIQELGSDAALCRLSRYSRSLRASSEPVLPLWMDLR